MMKMNWENLKKNKCSQCGKDTALKSPYSYDPGRKILIHPCGFKMSELRYKEVVSGMVTKGFKEYAKAVDDITERGFDHVDRQMLDAYDNVPE